ncbi:histidine kinase [Algoriphagus sp. AGSA1]|uniref:sensor histidine kinase n=1 Tax=Algoriphagus sp. AGSA1 TaxID=2907213 RepID=UPI001F3BD130|nr:histidine kinase [Algoriphagus sp. AGSA1]MCE7054251.1 histidine kinase [Algoriphagus sp. AGSA1]
MPAGLDIKKLGFRVLVATVTFVFIKLMIDADYSDGFMNITTSFYYVSGYFFFILTWGLNDWLIKRQLEKDHFIGLDWKSGLQILGTTLLIIIPLIGITYYLAVFQYSGIFEIDAPNPWFKFRTDFSRASIIVTTIVLLNLLYFAGKVKSSLHEKMVELENEVLASNYKTLTSQISPHFLFNSLNTLTSLMYEDRDLASDFTSRLASCYRYILDNKDQDLIGLDRELSFLDSYIFMMDVRHKMSLKIKTKIDLNPREYVIPTLCLQMLVENALKHNYFSNERPLSITILIEGASIKVSNTLRKRNDPQSSTQLGLENIKKRFSFYSTKPVEIIQENGLFTICLPLLKKDISQIKPLQNLSW